jgi:hypothetical protein
MLGKEKGTCVVLKPRQSRPELHNAILNTLEPKGKSTGKIKGKGRMDRKPRAHRLLQSDQDEIRPTWQQQGLLPGRQKAPSSQCRMRHRFEDLGWFLLD